MNPFVAQKAKTRHRIQEAMTTMIMTGPATIAMIVLIFIPALLVALFSFTDYQFGAQSFNWVGFDNYISMFTDRFGRRAVVNTLLYVALVMPLSMFLALIVALGIQSVARWSPRMAAFLRTAYFMPVAATLVAMATVFQMLLHPSLGLVNQVLAQVGLPGQEWLSDRGLVMYTLAVIGLWETIGYNMVLFLAGLSAIPSQLYDAAEIDGADHWWDRFWTVTWPMLGPTTLFVLVITATRSFRVFETVATLTQGGPAFASDTLIYAMYREGFVYFKAGYSSAITVVFFIGVLILTLTQVRIVEKKVHYR
ncbi:carbohydrate ABC transporter permease [Cohaesibacter celericrescens]|uniref:ABC transporter permease n=1 Tax=Cohaesibacter celericrescens TaxID=2067669 RepID=A0A2N5XVN7_9HYPH|nr:sugar ABC transporter permease [Cohaesibacter celericrescens]PLW78559.1 ABC transporter permease [Cohaesibacter celericrescens]